jgi:VIT1/CCC1 family predicted Fe2+/Mn2+ transporter
MEITEYLIYKRLAKAVKDQEDSRILDQITEDELRHSQDFGKYTKQVIKPDMWKVWKYYLISRIFGFTFGIKLMEQGEKRAQENYSKLIGKFPDIDKWINDEETHEQKLLAMLDEDRLHYIGAVVLGLNDALVELTGALAGLTLALQNVKLIALSGLITGIAASLSMAASEYLAARSENAGIHPARAAVYTGVSYVVTVILLALPYLLITNYIIDLAITLTLAVIIIAFFNYYITVAKGEPFRKSFLEMAGLSLGVSAISFVIGYLIRKWLGVNV